jgi:GNAT superfamily N-acetyltransferase
MFAAVSGGEVVGVAGFDGRQARTVLGRPDWHGKALGSLLMRDIEELAAEMGCSELSLLSSTAATLLSTLGLRATTRCLLEVSLAYLS